MNPGKPLTRKKPLKRYREGPSASRETKPWAQALVDATLKPLVRGAYGGTTEPAPKTEAYRDPALLAMAERKPCLLQVRGVCNGRTDTTVACHSNQQMHGKAGARKADDCYTVWGCSACHEWLDRGPAIASHKEAVFRHAHARQVECWKLSRLGAAKRALVQLGAAR
jgi:hypothetical protein